MCFEKNENHREALIREMMEEFGVPVLVTDFITTNTHQYPELLIALHAYSVEFLSDNFVLADHDSILWVGADELLSIDFSGADLPIMRKVIDLFE